ncbi:zinc finger X-chromosomal protein-like [Mercenaria mercenaria]|uniref:zinc finger X-chromosomal protein-like n=1 Tax=Mercenaria mercenaria TaxID=6596 RepID=UPI00234F7789|nr:zinc finger X-chromosomal protein-like [Mercenaria mercenaria]
MELDPTSPMSIASATEMDDPFIQYLTKGSINRLEADKQQDLNNRTISGKKSRKKTKKSKVDTNKIYKCSQCPFSTLYRCDFRRHLERHKKKSFACSECNMPFMTLGHLNGHKESAHGIKRPSDKIVWRNCEKCEYKTRHSSDMARHRRRHDSALDSCKYCHRPFCHLGRLKEHIKREHGDTDVQSANSNEKRSVETCKEAESVTETNDVTKYRVNDNTTDRECKDSYSEEECKISNQMQALKQCVLYEDGSSRQKSVNNKRGRDKVTFKKKNKPSQTGKDSADLYTENADKTGKDIRSVIGKTNKMICQHDLTCQEEKNSKRVDPRQMKKCAFCGFSTSFYNDLKQHLDEHDIVELSDESDTDIERVSRENDLDNVNVDYVENSNLSGRSITIIDDEVNMMLHEVEDSTRSASESDEAFIQDVETSNTNNDLQQSDTDSDTDVDDEMETEDDVPIS